MAVRSGEDDAICHAVRRERGWDASQTVQIFPKLGVDRSKVKVEVNEMDVSLLHKTSLRILPPYGPPTNAASH
ncbi:hypothetical protein F2P81_015693 [Scophthalmus maximus]|uniref:Uncharacterized protein n=1 Tax=Scophthalmus maximus TaxID=52904 RepID=A0A6A4SFX9_SCOMX|nr:hypothetical protein F2P81_015693 [Scophthalmus maximus]